MQHLNRSPSPRKERLTEARPMSSIAFGRPGSSLRPKYDIFPDFDLQPHKPPGPGNVKVVVRVRPFLPRETVKECVNLISMKASTTTINPPPPLPASATATSSGHRQLSTRRNMEPKSFTFDHSFWSCDHKSPASPYADQGHVYDCVGREFLDHNMEGYHTCIFAYGQTGSGKSYTMMGSEAEPGLIPRTCTDLFERIEKMTNANVTCTVRVSYFEVYNEQVRDLLATNKPDGPTISGGAHGQNLHRLKVRESPTEGPYVEDLSEFSVKSANEVLKYLGSGNKARSVAATKMNDVSSRSHAVFTLVVKQVITDPVTDATEEKTSRIRLVDLAGSERANSTGATGQRLREGSNINKSLTTLGRVIAALADNSGGDGPGSPGKSAPKRKAMGGSGSGDSVVIPYRDSVLTWLLKDSLGGNSKTAMVACISPTDYDETLSTLRYADQAKNIKTRAVVNQDIVSAADRDKLLLEMQERINNLQSVLSQQKQEQEHDHEKGLGVEKVKGVIRYYEDRAIAEESKRRAIQAENLAIKRHNKLLSDHLREVTNKTVGTLQVVGDKDDEQLRIVPTLSYEVLHTEFQELLQDIAGFKENLQQDIAMYSS